MAKFCSQCGKALSPDAKFCDACGAKVDSAVNLSKESTTETPNAPVSNRRVPDSGIVENFFKRDGRLNRWRYFKRFLVLTLVQMIVLIVIFVTMSNMIGELTTRGIVVTNFFYVIWQIPLYCLMVRRLHDIGRDEKLAQICFAINLALVILSPEKNINATVDPSPVELIILLAAGFIGLYIMFCPGTKGANQYGEDPLEGNA